MTQKPILLFFTCLFTVILHNLPARATAAPASFADIVEPLMPAVVNIYTTKYSKNSVYKAFPPGSMFEQFNELFDNFNNPYSGDELYSHPDAIALGSGFIIDEEGYIVTNHHVVRDADEIRIKLFDNTELSAKLVGSDKVTDLALLKVKPIRPLKAVSFGDSSTARVGDWVIAIGNPFGLGGTVTAGIISSKGRDLDLETGMIDDYLQTDAAINSGNSGGPMFNLMGEVIGINTALISPSGTNIGIGFAIPSAAAKNIIEKLKREGKVDRGMLGIRVQPLTPEIADGFGLKNIEGVLVINVDSGSSAAEAGLKEGDIITSVNGQVATSPRKLRVLISELDANANASLSIIRNGQNQNIECKLTPVENIDKLVAAKVSGNSFKLNGVTFANVAAADDKAVTGVIVTAVDKKSPWRLLHNNDIVLAIDQVKLRNLAELQKAYENALAQPKHNIVLLIKRQNTTLFIGLPLIENSQNEQEKEY